MSATSHHLFFNHHYHTNYIVFLMGNGIVEKVVVMVMPLLQGKYRVAPNIVFIHMVWFLVVRQSDPDQARQADDMMQIT